VQGVDKRFVHLQSRLATRKHTHLPSLIGHVVQVQCLRDNLLRRHLRVFRELGVTPWATQIATAKANEHSGNAAVYALALQGKEYFVNLIQNVKRLVLFIDCHIAFALLDGDFVAILHMVANPFGDILRRRVDIQYIVDILMVECVFDHAFDMCEIGHHAVLAQFFRLAINDNNPVMAVQRLALALVRQIQVMRRRNLYSFFYEKHF
jgi:hypothetical protein